MGKAIFCLFISSLYLLFPLSFLKGYIVITGKGKLNSRTVSKAAELRQEEKSLLIHGFEEPTVGHH